jgi:glycosyltransferase involved in cell wall biosynthesis
MQQKPRPTRANKTRKEQSPDESKVDLRPNDVAGTRAGAPKMRIALDLSGIHEQTGVRVYAAQLLRELQLANTDVEFFVIMRRRDASIYLTDAPNFTPLFIPSTAEGALSNIAWHWSGFLRLMRKWRIDIVHQLDCNRIFPSSNLTLVVTVHGLIDPAIPGRRHLMRQQYNSVVVPRLLPLAARIISVSNNTKRDLLRYSSVHENKITVIHEGCALRGTEVLDEAAGRALLAAKYGLREKFILYVARLEHPNKNHVSLLQAYKSLRHADDSLPHLVFVGGDSYRADVVRQAIDALSLRDRVTLTGFVPDAHLPAFYRCALAYACPTLYEGFGLPLLEAMQFGVPIVCSETSSLPELVGSAAIRFDPHKVESIATAINRVLSDQGLRTILIREGFAQLRRFSATEMANKTLDVYRQATLNGHDS